MLPTCQNVGGHAVCGWLQDSGLPGDHLRRILGPAEGEPQAGSVVFGGRREAEPGSHPGGHPHRLHLTLWQLYHARGRELPAAGDCSVTNCPTSGFGNDQALRSINMPPPHTSGLTNFI